MIMNHQLPDKPSELIRVALDDLRTCYDAKNRTCQVCLAGAVMANTCKDEFVGELGEYDNYCTPTYRNSNNRKMFALNAFRQGRVAAGLLNCNISRVDVPDYQHVCEYSEDSELFFENMEDMVLMLQEYGL